MVTFLPDVPPGSDWAHAFRDNVDKFSGGKMKIKLMGPEAIPAPDAPAAAQRGTVDIADSMYTFASTLIKGLDSLARSEYSSPELRNTPAFKWVREASEKVGLYYLGAGVSSEAQVQTVIYTRKPISTLADLKGLKIGAAGGSNKAWIEGLGAVCVPVNFTDYYTSMERGTIDGYNIGIPGIQDFSLTPVTAAMVDEPVSSCGAGLFMNLDKYNKLTPTQKEVMDKASIQNEIDGAKMFTETVKKVKDDISKAGVKIIKLSPADSKAMYTAYQEGMWADDMKKWPELVPQLKEWILKADFPRKQ
jgi:TRAP-type C4-dicarboxylate transport system substrate-binding protein